MNNLRSLSDKSAIALSLLCTIHCLLLPLLIVSLPAAFATVAENEIFHKTMVFLVIPLSLYGLTLGCKQHKRFQVLALGGAGLAFLLAALFVGHELFGESGEKILTLIGSAFIATGHILNYRLCQQHGEQCSCEHH